MQKPISFDIDFKENSSPSKNSTKIMEKLEERKKMLETSAEKRDAAKIREKLEQAELRRKKNLEDKTRVLQEMEVKKMQQKQQNEAVF